MSVRTLVVDSGGTTRLVTRFLAVDSGGTTRLIQRAFVVDSGGTARLIYVGAVVSVTDPTVVAVLGLPGGAAGIRYNPSGGVEIFDGSSWNAYEDYVTPTSAAGNYEIMMHETSFVGPGTPAGTMDTWLPLTSTQTWTLLNNGFDGTTWDLEVSFRPAGGSPVFTAVVNLISSPGA